MLTVDHSKSNKNQYVHLTGNLSGIDALSFRDNVHSIIYKDSDQLILDMTGVKEMDLTGFNAIVMLKKELTNAQRKTMGSTCYLVAFLVQKSSRQQTFLPLLYWSFHSLLWASNCLLQNL